MSTTRIKFRWLAVPLVLFSGITGPGLVSAKANPIHPCNNMLPTKAAAYARHLPIPHHRGFARYGGWHKDSGRLHSLSGRRNYSALQRYRPQFMPLLKQAGY
jgi:hypothetical protein